MKKHGLWFWIFMAILAVILTVAALLVLTDNYQNEKVRSETLVNMEYLPKEFYRTKWDRIRSPRQPKLDITWINSREAEGEYGEPECELIFNISEITGHTMHLTGIETACFFKGYEEPSIIYHDADYLNRVYWETKRSFEADTTYFYHILVPWDGSAEAFGLSVLGRDTAGNELEYHFYCDLEKKYREKNKVKK